MKIFIKRNIKRALFISFLFTFALLFIQFNINGSTTEVNIPNQKIINPKKEEFDNKATFLKNLDKVNESGKIQNEEHKKEVIYEDQDFKIKHEVVEEKNEIKNRNENDVAVPPAKKETLNEPGEYGKPVIMNPKTLSAQEKIEYQKGWKNNAFNEYVSNMIRVDRQLEDVRDKECLNYKYSTNLPSTSVILCFHNEAWSVLLRSVHSVINRSPPELLKEVILVDDFSTMEHLKLPLEQYMSKWKKVKIVRAKKREGLIRARLLGASAASGEVLTFLDSHIECTEGWLPPLLDPIAQNSSNVTVPVIDSIDDKTFAYEDVGIKNMQVGGFSWDLIYRWHHIPKRDKIGRKDTDPVNTPTMAGGLFSINKKYFEYLGTYDSGFDIWGGENLELSFKIWMCGGIMKMIPCSHVGHIFRQRSPYEWDSKKNVLKNNLVRLAEVWLDDYKQFYYAKINNKLENYGDITSRKELRKSLQCKSFDWYIKNIYPDIFLPSDALYSGEIRNAITNICIDSNLTSSQGGKDVIAYPCHKQGGNQAWLMTKLGEIRQDGNCLDYDSRRLRTYSCHSLLGNQYWQYTKDYQIKHMVRNACLEVSQSDHKLILSKCSLSVYQRWKLSPNTVTLSGQ